MASHFTWPVEKYSYSISPIASASSERPEWIHLPHRDNLYLVFTTERKVAPGSTTPTNRTSAKVVFGLQELEDIDLTELLPRSPNSDGPAIFVIGRSPCLAIKYIAKDQNLRRFQIRFRATADYEAAKMAFENHSCPVRQRLATNPPTTTGQPQGLTTQVHTQVPSSQIAPASQFGHAPQTPQHQITQSTLYPPLNQHSTHHLGSTHQQQQHTQFPEHGPTQPGSHSAFGQPFAAPSFHRAIRPTPAAAYDFPADERPYNHASSLVLTPPNTAWGVPATNFEPAAPAAPDLSDSYLDQELPPPRPPANFFGTPSSGEKSMVPETQEAQKEALDSLNLPPLKKPTPATKEYPTPNKTPAASKKRIVTAAPRPSRATKVAQKRPPAPPKPTLMEKVAAVEAIGSDTESESAASRASTRIPDSNPTKTPTSKEGSTKSTPTSSVAPKPKPTPRKRKRVDEGVVPDSGTALEDMVKSIPPATFGTKEQIERLIVDALQDDEFVRLCEVVGGVWQGMGITEVGRGLFDLPQGEGAG